MTLWRVERLRLLRTGRWIALVAVFLLLGLGDPLLTHYLGQLLSGSTGDTYIHITVSRPRPSDGMNAYFNNITTLGTLVTVVVSGLAFAVRANPPLAALYLTHVPSRAALLLPRLVTIAVAVTFLAATLLRGQVAAIAVALAAVFVAVPFTDPPARPHRLGHTGSATPARRPACVVRAGANLAPDRVTDRRTWADFLAERVGQPAGRPPSG